MVKRAMKHEKFHINVHGERDARYFIAVSDALSVGPADYKGVTVEHPLAMNDMWFYDKGLAREAFATLRPALEDAFPDHYFIVIQVENGIGARIIHSVFDEAFLIAHRSPPKDVKYDREARPEHPESGTW